MSLSRPSYIRLYETGELQKRIEALNEILARCRLCPRNCNVNRLEGEKGVCRTGVRPVVSSFNPHFGEEPPLVGHCGSGTIFLTFCNLKCVFCQNYDISHLGAGQEVSVDELSRMMLSLQRRGCHNINFVTPTHQVAQIVAALPQAIEGGLEVPLVYNCGGYESLDTIRLLHGIFDIYMPDMKYGSDEAAGTLSGALDYCSISRAALKEMHRQVGDLVLDSSGIAERGLIVRHLVLPDGIAGTREVMGFIAHELSPGTYVNIMDQYRPCHKASESELYPSMARRITSREFDEAVSIATDEGLTRLAGTTA